MSCAKTTKLKICYKETQEPQKGHTASGSQESFPVPSKAISSYQFSRSHFTLLVTLGYSPLAYFTFTSVLFEIMAELHAVCRPQSYPETEVLPLLFSIPATIIPHV